MNKFGILNNCYWMLISTVEKAREHMNPLYFTMNEEYVVRSIEAGKVIAVNEASGFHAGKLDDYTDIVEQESSRYPEVKCNISESN